jgi:NADPH:quinone reductase-like Zn-dependent oxidoreductase
LKRGDNLFINGASGAVGHAAVAIAGDIGAEIVGRMGPQSIGRRQLPGMRLTLDYTKPIPPTLNGSFDIVFDVNGSLSIKEGAQLIKRGGTIIDIAPTQQKFLKALFSGCRQVIFSNPRAEYLQPVVDLAAAGKLSIPIAQTISLVDAPALLASLERGD